MCPKGKLSYTNMVAFEQVLCAEKVLPGPGSYPAPGAGHGHLLLLVLLCLFDCLAQVANWDKWLFLGERLNIYLYKFAYISYTFYPQPSAILHKYIFHIYVTVSRSLSGSHGANIWKAVGAAFTTFHHQLHHCHHTFCFSTEPVELKKITKMANWWQFINLKIRLGENILGWWQILLPMP